MDWDEFKRELARVEQWMLEAMERSPKASAADVEELRSIIRDTGPGEVLIIATEIIASRDITVTPDEAADLHRMVPLLEDVDFTDAVKDIKVV